MHIAVNALLVSGAFSGVQHAILHQLRALLNLDSPHRFTVVTLRDVPIAEHLGNVRQPYDVLHTPLHSGHRFQRILWEQCSLPQVLRSAQVDLLYAPGYLTSLCWRGPSVVFVHDTIALSHPRLCTFSNALNYRLLLPPSARHASVVAVPSAASARDVVSFCRVPASRIAVVPLGVEIPPTPSATDIAQAHETVGVPGPFLLAASTIEPKKNFGNLIRWFDHWKDAGIPHHLVIVGKWGWKCGEVRQALAGARHREAIHVHGYLPQTELLTVMAAADLLLMPSRYEGFGLPALEAMGMGTPVVVSDQGALPETVGDAGLVFPLDDARWQSEIPALLANLARLQSLREAGLSYAATRTWERTGELLMQAFDAAMKGRK